MQSGWDETRGSTMATVERVACWILIALVVALVALSLVAAALEVL